MLRRPGSPSRPRDGSPVSHLPAAVYGDANRRARGCVALELGREFGHAPEVVPSALATRARPGGDFQAQEARRFLGTASGVVLLDAPRCAGALAMIARRVGLRQAQGFGWRLWPWGGDGERPEPPALARQTSGQSVS